LYDETMTDRKDDKGLEKGLTSYGDRGFSLFLRKAFIKGAGYTDDALSRPVVGIVDTGSAYNPCHGNAPQLLEAGEAGVMLSGGLPVEFPTISIHESFAHPTSMYLRNLMSMDTEEMIRAQPDGCGRPHRRLRQDRARAAHGRGIGGRAVRLARHRLDAHRLAPGRARGRLHRLPALLGTLSRRGNRFGRDLAREQPARRERRHLLGDGHGKHDGVRDGGARHDGAGRGFGAGRHGGPRPRRRAQRRDRGGDREEAPHAGQDPHEAGIRECAARAPRDRGSTNGVIHITAVAGRLGIDIDLAQLDAMGRETPVLLDLKPSGKHYMEDLHRAGGVPTLLRELRPLLHLDALTVTGRTLGEEIDAAPAPFAQDVVRPFANPIYPQGGIAVLRGNLAPGGAIIKQSAADPKLMKHEGRAVVFENAEDLANRVDSDALDVRPEDILVLKNIGPKGAPGMPEAGYLPIPKKLARAGVKDMVRISDGRMSGTAAGTIVLHVTPEAATGGPLAWVQSGDRIRLDVAARELELLVSDEELAKRKDAKPVTEPTAARGYLKLFLESVTQADKGVDFDFLRHR
jgi:dihydroxy-acid dehydratase